MLREVLPYWLRHQEGAEGGLAVVGGRVVYPMSALAAMEAPAVMYPVAGVVQGGTLVMGELAHTRILEVTALGAEAAVEAGETKPFIKIKMTKSNISMMVEAGPEAMLACLALA